MQARARDDAELTFATRPLEAPRGPERSLKTLPLFLLIGWGYRLKTGCRFVRYEDMDVGGLH